MKPLKNKLMLVRKLTRNYISGYMYNVSKMNITAWTIHYAIKNILNYNIRRRNETIKE